MKSLSNWEVFYIPPEESEVILKLASKLREYQAFNPFKDSLEISISRISNQITELKKILFGKRSELNIHLSNKVYFPLIEEDTSQKGDNLFSYLESTTVKISKGECKK